jgi:CARDB/Putative Ig domain
MKRRVYRIMTLATLILLGMVGTALAVSTGPTITVPTTTNMGANQVSLNLTSSATGTGYFTLLYGYGADCGSGVQVQAGQSGPGIPAPYHGSLPLTAYTTASYTIRNLAQNSTYTACFTADDGAIVQDVPVTVSVATSPTTAITTPSWVTVGTSGVYPGVAGGNSLAFDQFGTPYLAFRDNSSLGNQEVNVRKYDGTTWVPLGKGVVSVGSAYYPSLAFAPTGTPYVAYEESTTPYYGITVMKYDGTSWVQVGNRAFATNGSSASLVISSDGTPYVAFRDNRGYYPDITVMKYNGTDWVTVGTERFFGNNANLYHSYYNGKISLVLNSNNIPYVAFDYTNGNTDGAVVMKYDGTGWVTVGSGNIAIGGVYGLSLAFGPDGLLYAGFADTGGVGVTQATVLKYDGSTWVALGGLRFTTGNSIASTTLAISPDNTPYLAYADGANGKATVRKFDGSSWSLVGTAGFTKSYIGDPSLAFAPDGSPYYACTDAIDYSSAVWRLGNRPLAITQTTLANGLTGVGYTASLSTDIGVAPMKWSITSGSLPAGLSLDAVTGVFSGIPTTATSSTFTIQVTDAGGNSTTKLFTITVISNLAVTTTTLPNGAVGATYSQLLTVSGGYGTYIWSLNSGNLPAGLSLSANGTISGTPTTATAGSFTVLIVDAGGNSAVSTTLSITVASPALSISTVSLSGGTVSTAYSQTLTAVGGAAPYTWSISSGTLPTGLTLNASTGIISGTPSKAATSTFTVKNTDSKKATTTKSLSITVAAAKPDLVITTVSGPTAITRGTTKYTFTATVKNQGAASAGASTLGFYLSTDTAIANTDVLVGTVSITTLAAGASKTVTLSAAIPTTTAAKTYYIGALADSKSAVVESNETNNSMATTTLVIVK